MRYYFALRSFLLLLILCTVSGCADYSSRTFRGTYSDVWGVTNKVVDTYEITPNIAYDRIAKKYKTHRDKDNGRIVALMKDQKRITLFSVAVLDLKMSPVEDKESVTDIYMRLSIKHKKMIIPGHERIKSYESLILERISSMMKQRE